jgi:hypothetical protein
VTRAASFGHAVDPIAGLSGGAGLPHLSRSQSAAEPDRMKLGAGDRGWAPIGHNGLREQERLAPRASMVVQLSVRPKFRCGWVANPSDQPQRSKAPP